ncbi:MAG: PRC-barrel domain-containing protein [Chloroflexota bacterium]
MQIQPARMNPSPVSPLVLSAGALVGDRVVNLKGEDMGKVEELMVDIDQGRVSYAVVAFNGPGGRLVAVPWDLLGTDSENRCFVLDADRGLFENAPGFDKHNWAQMASREWVAELYRYYSLPTYW